MRTQRETLDIISVRLSQSAPWPRQSTTPVALCSHQPNLKQLFSSDTPFLPSISPRLIKHRITDLWELKCRLLFSFDLLPNPATKLSVIHSREWTMKLFNKVFVRLHLCCVLQLVITSWHNLFLYKIYQLINKNKIEEIKSIITVQGIIYRKIRVYSQQQKYNCNNRIRQLAFESIQDPLFICLILSRLRALRDPVCR